MSFSFIVKQEDVTSSLIEAIDAKIADIPNPVGKTEAEGLSSTISETIQTMSEGKGNLISASISGSASEFNSALSIYLSFAPAPTQEQIPDEVQQPEPVEALEG